MTANSASLPGRVLVRLAPPPPTRGDCELLERPCRRACRYNLGIRPRSGQHANFRLPMLYDPASDACCLDMIDELGGEMATLESIGAALGASRQVAERAFWRALLRPHVQAWAKEWIEP